MYFREDPKQAAELLKQAIPLMVERKIPTNPCNFALWYAYVAERDHGLKKELDRDFSSSKSYFPEKSEELFFDYFVKPFISDNKDAQTAVVSLLNGLSSSALRTAEGAKDYGQALQQGLEKMQNESDPAKLEETLKGLLQETEAADDLNQTFYKELRSAKEEIESLKRQLKDSEQNAFVDSLTKIGNRRSFDRALEGAMAMPGARPLLLLIDLDFFKKCNDTYGHLTGDRILAALGKLLQTFGADHIQVARYGGEEFAAVLSKGTIEQALNLAESIREKVTKVKIKQQDRIIDGISASIGVAQLRPGETKESLIQRVDKALYRAKGNGRNQVQSAEACSPEPA